MKIGTCSGNYLSWLGFVYSAPSPAAVGYLLDYLGAVGDDVTFMAKVTDDMSLAHNRNRGSKEQAHNESFLNAKPDKGRVVEMSMDQSYRGGKLIDINIHYEGSAPITTGLFATALGLA